MLATLVSINDALRESFSIAWSNSPELRAAVHTVQQIYNANYQFAVPPKRPTVTAEVGDGRVRLSWDDVAERSVDPVTFDFDFEGYRIYRSTDPDFLDPKKVMNGVGTQPIGNGQPIHNYDQLRVIVDANAGKPVKFLVDRHGKQVELTTIPRMNAQEKRVMIGVGLGAPFKPASSPVETLSLGAQYTYLNIRGLIALPAQMIRGSLNSDQSRLVGLKGIYDILHQTVNHDVQASETPAPSSDPIDQPVQTLLLLASLTISLGIFNLFPFPALDGGRIIFVLPELEECQLRASIGGLAVKCLVHFQAGSQGDDIGDWQAEDLRITLRGCFNVMDDNSHLR